MKKTYKKNLKYFSCFFVIILMIFSFNITASRYMEQIISNDDIVAEPILTLSNNNLEYQIKDMLPGQQQEYIFSVSNVDGNRKNEVLLKYSFVINTGNEIPLNIELYDITSGEKKIEIVEGKTEEISIGYNEEIIKNYKLKVLWNKSDNSYEYENKTCICKVELQGEQVSN